MDYWERNVAEESLAAQKRKRRRPTLRLVKGVIAVYAKEGLTDKGLTLVSRAPLDKYSYREVIRRNKVINFYDLSLLRDLSKLYLQASIASLKKAASDEKLRDTANYYLSEAYALVGNPKRSAEVTASFIAASKMPPQFRDRALAGRREAFERFCTEKRHWLDDYALFMSLKGAHDGAMWNTWELALIQRHPQALQRWRQRLADKVLFHQYTQFQFSRQWRALRRYANERGIRIVGDIPIFVAPDSADAWSDPEVFYMDDRGQLTVVAGVPARVISQLATPTGGGDTVE